MRDTVLTVDAQQLLVAATLPALASFTLEERRRRVTESVGELINADAGHWAWGRGNPLNSTIAPIAIIDFGYTDDQRATLIEHSLQPEAIATFQARVASRMNGRRVTSVTRQEVLPDEEWRQSPLWSGYVARLKLDSWVHSVAYFTDDAWSCFHFLRCAGKQEFTRREADLVELALTGVSWLSACPEETISPDRFALLTPRQRTVMVLLLDGCSRREIAARLDISEETVGDHITTLYKHFGVRTSGQLAAQFLKGV